MLPTFALLRGAGGSPFRLETGGVPPTLQREFTDYYALDRPWVVEFAHYVREVATLNFGPSFVDRYVSVDDVVHRALPVTGKLAGIAAAWAILIGVPLGLLSVPIFRVVELAAVYAMRDWHLVPLGWEHWSTRLLAGLVLGLAPAGYVARLIRAAVVVAVVGLAYGGIAGFAGGRVDETMMRVLDGLFAIPRLPFYIVFLVVMAGRDTGVWTLIVALSAVSWLATARLVRMQVGEAGDRDRGQQHRPDPGPNPPTATGPRASTERAART